jgi:hypothetical protein
MIKIDKGKLEQLQIEQAKRARATAFAAEADAPDSTDHASVR